MSFEEIAEKWIHAAFVAHESVSTMPRRLDTSKNVDKLATGIIYRITKNGYALTLKNLCIQACQDAANEYEMTRS